MKKCLRSVLIASAVTMLLATGDCWAAPPSARVVPEIDTGAGGTAIAVLVSALLLAAEKRRRSS